MNNVSITGLSPKNPVLEFVKSHRDRTTRAEQIRGNFHCGQFLEFHCSSQECIVLAGQCAHHKCERGDLRNPCQSRFTINRRNQGPTSSHQHRNAAPNGYADPKQCADLLLRDASALNHGVRCPETDQQVTPRNTVIAVTMPTSHNLQEKEDAPRREA